MRRFNDSVVQSRVDKRLLATVVSYYLGRGIVPRTIRELVREVIENFVEVLVSNGRVKLVEESENARQLLDNVYGTRAFNPGGRGIENEYRNLALDDIERRPNIVGNDPDYGKVVRKLISEEEKGELIKRDLERVKYDKDGLAIVDDRHSIRAIPSDLKNWGKNKEEVSSKGKVESAEKEYIDSKVSMIEYEKEDRKDQCTMRELTDSELVERERKDRERLERELEEIKSFDFKSMAIKEEDL